MIKKRFTIYLLIAFSMFALVFASDVKTEDEPVYVGANYFTTSCESEISPFASCNYYCAFCEPMNMDGSCTIDGSCC